MDTHQLKCTKVGTTSESSRDQNLLKTHISSGFFIWNPVPLVRGSTRWYVLVHTSTSSSGYEAVREMSKLYIPVHTGTYGHMTFLWQYILVCTGMYFSVQGGTRRYNQVQGGTWWYKEQYKEVQDSMYWYVLVCTNPGPMVQPGPGMLPCGWIRCCNSARPIALYWRQVHLMTAMQAQACFNQPLVRPTL